MLRFFPLIIIVLLCASCFYGTDDINNKKSDDIKIFLVKQEKDDISLIEASRPFDSNENKVKQAVQHLLRGITPQEERQDIDTEIPVGTRLLSFKEDGQMLIIDLSKQFMSGGGSMSMKIRTDQLIKTVENARPNKSVLLFVEGKQIKDIGGEGLIINNPIVQIDNGDNNHNSNTEHPTNNVS